MASSPPQELKIQTLQAGRALAALAVLLVHSTLYAPSIGQTGLVDFGIYGVDFFFVLSGFIIFHSTVDTGKDPRSYFLGRLRRVYLPYLPIGIIVALYSVHDESRSWSWLVSLTLLPIRDAPALAAAWTLKHEVLFYLLFGLFYFTGRLWWGLFAWGAIMVTLAMLGIKGGVAFSMTNIEFLIGIAAACAYRRGRGGWPYWLGGVLALLIFIGMGADHGRSLLLGIFFASVVLGAATLERNRRLSVPAWLVQLGAASYALYLVHTPVIDLLGATLPLSPAATVSAAITGSVIVGLLYHRYVERPVLIATAPRPQLTAGRPDPAQ